VVRRQFLAGVRARNDVHQGGVGDCHLMAGLAEVADKNPQAIRNVFFIKGDGSYTVRSFDNGEH
jgi:hypothetical protein